MLKWPGCGLALWRARPHGRSARRAQMAHDEYLFTSESVTEGHPDKIADQI